MGHPGEREADQAAERGGEGKLIARAEAEFGPLEARGAAPADQKKKLTKSFAKQAAGVRRGAEAPKVLPPLMYENLLAWEVLVAAFEGRQFEYVQISVAMMGGIIARPEIVGFRYESVLGLIKLMAPRDRRRETFEKFRWVAEYALRAARGGGGDGQGSDD